MKIGIVGAEGSKFTLLGEQRARQAIKDCLDPENGDIVVSGHCHLGGIDIWAEEAAKELGLESLIYPPAELNWSNGYKPRNLQIAHNSDLVVCITVDKLPPDFKGMKFDTCYHCARNGRDGKDHVKSGGCWTVVQAMKKGKKGAWITIAND